MITVEDYIELLAGVQDKNNSSFSLDRSDYNLITSLARQTFRGVGFTDRQFELAKLKLLAYNDQFVENGFSNIEDHFDNLRIPLRRIDRSKWIKIVVEDNSPQLAIRFIFNKKYISKLANINASDKNYDKTNKIHYFELTENNIFNIIKEFKDANFEIDEELLDMYEKLEYMDLHRDEFIPGVYNFNVKNVHPSTEGYINKLLGKPTSDNLFMFIDRQRMLGLKHFDEHDSTNAVLKLDSLTKGIVNRKNTSVFIDKATHTVNSLVSSLHQLSRFPLLVVLGEDPLSDLIQLTEAVDGIVDAAETSVIFRLENDEYGQSFNQYIKERNLNNSIDKNTKIVYTSIRNKINKPLLRSGWVPDCCLYVNAVNDRKLQSYTNQSDLIIYYDDSTASPWIRSLRIQKI